MTVLQLVARERARLGFAIIARGVGAVLAIVAAIAGIFTLALGDARWIARPSLPMLAWVVAVALVAGAVWWTRRAVHRSASDHSVATAIESERALRAGSLRGALEVANTGSLGRAAADRMAAKLGAQGNVLAPRLHRGMWQRGGIAGAAAVVALVSLGAARAKAPDGWRALRHPVGAWTGSILPPLAIVDAPAFVLRGERLKLTISAPDRRQITLRTRATGAAWLASTLDVSQGSAIAALGPVDADLAIVVADGRSHSDTVVVRVTDRPFLGDVAIRATFPAYLNRAPETVPTGEPVRVPRGTMLAIRGRASTPLTAVSLVHEADTLAMSPDGHAFSGRLSAERSGRYTWQALGAQGAIADVPQPIELDVVPDSAPGIDLVAPAHDTVVLADARIEVRAAASDDHLLASIALKTWRRASDGQIAPATSQAFATPNAGTWQGALALDLAPRGLQPGDELHVVAVATDDSPWRQTAQSRELILRVPSMTEQRANARTLADSAAARALEAAKQEKQLQQKTSDAAKARPTAAKSSDAKSGATEKPMSFQSAEQARAMAKEQEKLQETIKQIQKNAADLEKALKAAGALDTALEKQLREAQQLLKEAITPDMQQQLDDVMKATQKLSAEDVKKALENLADQQKRLKEQLDKSAEMLKRAAMEGAMQTLKDEAKEIAKKERENATAQEKGDKNAQKQAKDLADQARDLSQLVQKLEERLQKEKAEAGPQKLKPAEQNAQKSSEAMQRAAQKAGEKKEQQGQKQAEKDGQKQGEKQGQKDGQKQGQKAGDKQGEKEGEKPGDKAGDKSGDKQGEQKDGQEGQEGQEGEQGKQSQKQGSGAAKEGADQMEQAAKALSEARQSQVDEWKNQLSNEMDKAIQETMQLSRQQQDLAQRAQKGEQGEQLRSEQSAVQQGVDKLGERMQQQAGKSSHISQQAQGSMADAKRKVQQATEQTAQNARGQEMSSTMQEAASALNKAAAMMVRDRERTANAQSASGLAEMLQQMRDAAKQQGQMNGQAQSLMPLPGAGQSSQQAQQVRQLSQKQRELADKVDEIGEDAGSNKPGELAKEMREIAQQMQNGRVDNNVLERQQRLFKRMLDAGLSLEKDEHEDTGKRESKSANGDEHGEVTNTDAAGKAANKFREPSWTDLRGLTAEERRAVLEYFKRINASNP